MLPSDFFRRDVVLSFQEDAIGIRQRDVIGPDNMMWGALLTYCPYQSLTTGGFTEHRVARGRE
jgi:hypothetical protein